MPAPTLHSVLQDGIIADPYYLCLWDLEYLPPCYFWGLLLQVCCTEIQHSIFTIQLLIHGFTVPPHGAFWLGESPALWQLADMRCYRILSHAIQTHVLDPKLLPSLLRTARAALFPNNTPAPPRIIPSAAEQLLIRQRCAETILSLIPAKIQDIYFGASIEHRVEEVEEVLNIFDDSYCNKHLLYGFVELIVVRLLPEMAEKGVAELLEDRLS